MRMGRMTVKMASGERLIHSAAEVEKRSGPVRVGMYIDVCVCLCVYVGKYIYIQ